METPTTGTSDGLDLRRALVIGLASALLVVALIEAAELLAELFAARQGRKLTQQSAEYLGTHDAAETFLARLAESITRKEPPA